MSLTCVPNFRIISRLEVPKTEGPQDPPGTKFAHAWIIISIFFNFENGKLKDHYWLIILFLFDFCCIISIRFFIQFRSNILIMISVDFCGSFIMIEIKRLSL
jgi:hypothetical protein